MHLHILQSLITIIVAATLTLSTLAAVIPIPNQASALAKRTPTPQDKEAGILALIGVAIDSIPDQALNLLSERTPTPQGEDANLLGGLGGVAHPLVDARTKIIPRSLAVRPRQVVSDVVNDVQFLPSGLPGIPNLPGIPGLPDDPPSNQV